MRLESDSAVILTLAHSNTEDSGLVLGFFLGGWEGRSALKCTQNLMNSVGPLQSEQLHRYNSEPNSDTTH